jgi:hypothetical protein
MTSSRFIYRKGNTIRDMNKTTYPHNSNGSNRNADGRGSVEIASRGAVDIASVEALISGNLCTVDCARARRSDTIELVVQRRAAGGETLTYRMSLSDHAVGGRANNRCAIYFSSLRRKTTSTALSHHSTLLHSAALAHIPFCAASSCDVLYFYALRSISLHGAALHFSAWRCAALRRIFLCCLRLRGLHYLTFHSAPLCIMLCCAALCPILCAALCCAVLC